jgi:Ca-activated chloride channel family protein
MVKGERMGSDIAICLDISNSMMAEDIQPNRLERSKRAVNNLLNELGSDRISLIVFAGSSYIQMPLTSDYSAVKLFLDQIDCNLISVQGTAIGDAIEKGMETFGYGDEDREWVKNKGRAIIVISDGENFEDDAEAAARKAASEDIVVCTMGMGLTEGTPIPEYRNGQRVGYKKDSQGNTVTTHLDEATLTAIAHAGKGIYVRATNINSGIQEIVRLIEGLEKDHYGEAMFSEYESRYQYPLVAAFLCLLAELLIFERRNKKFNLDKILKESK